MPTLQRTDRIQMTSFVLVAAGLILILYKGLLGALLAGMLVYSMVHALAPRLGRRFSNVHARAIVVTMLGVLVVGAITGLTWTVITFFQSDAGNSQALFQRLADMLDASRAQFPDWLQTRVPENAEALSDMLTHWLREHANETTLMGAEAGRGLISTLLGMIIGAMVALSEQCMPPSHRPLASALAQRLSNLLDAFERIVFAQVRIAALNTVFTGIYILIVLPLLGVHLPLSKTMVLLTFVLGLLPIIGNLMSNTVLVLVSLSYSLHLAVASLVFLVTIHKLEYFLNARIIGGQIQSKAWELLVAMMAMEAVFGVPGVVAAPVFYAYLKRELTLRELV